MTELLSEEEAAKLAKFSKAVQENTLVSQVCTLYSRLLDELVADVALQMHRSAKTKSMCMECFEEEQCLFKDRHIRHKPECSKYTGIVGKAQKDIHNQKPLANGKEIVKCFECQQELAASRFAPHLEKCMGNGRGRRAARKAPGVYNENKPSSPLQGDTEPLRKKRKMNGGTDDRITASKDADHDDFVDIDGDGDDVSAS